MCLPGIVSFEVQKPLPKRSCLDHGAGMMSKKMDEINNLLAAAKLVHAPGKETVRMIVVAFFVRCMYCRLSRLVHAKPISTRNKTIEADKTLAFHRLQRPITISNLPKKIRFCIEINENFKTKKNQNYPQSREYPRRYYPARTRHTSPLGGCWFERDSTADCRNQRSSYSIGLLTQTDVR